ncbi:MAG: hypothetical protein ACM3VT_18495 [Solirubrobacterales bacterium]
MWIRVLIGHKPESAAAAGNRTQTSAAAQTGSAAVTIKMIPLPRISGRNDSIHRDCFSMWDRAPFRQLVAPETSTDAEVPPVTGNRDQEVIQQVAQTLKLEAVVRNGSPHAFVNDRMLGVGDRFTVERGAACFEFEVLRIDEGAVLVQCNGIQLTLKLAQSVEVQKESKSL